MGYPEEHSAQPDTDGPLIQLEVTHFQEVGNTDHGKEGQAPQGQALAQALHLGPEEGTVEGQEGPRAGPLREAPLNRDAAMPRRLPTFRGHWRYFAGYGILMTSLGLYYVARGGVYLVVGTATAVAGGFIMTVAATAFRRSEGRAEGGYARTRVEGRGR